MLPDDVKILLDTLQNKGYESYIVGGCVRDSFLDYRVTNDWDICTNATPDQVLSIFSSYTVVETGLKHGTVTVLLNKIGYEITTYRVDGEYIDSRRPEAVSFVSNLEEDLNRRDFTINALAYNQSGLVDCNSGILDIELKLIKCVGNAHNRFTEDALRIIRGLRFASVLGFSIEDSTQSALFELKESLGNISNERISSEFCKLIVGMNAPEILRKYREVIAVFIPEIQDMFECEHNTPYHKYDVWEHSLKTVEHIDPHSENVLVLRLSAFFHDIGKTSTYTQDEEGVGHLHKHSPLSRDITQNILTRLKFSKNMISSVCLLVENYDYQLENSRKSILRFLNKFSMGFLTDYLNLKEADIKAQGESIHGRLEQLSSIRGLAQTLINENICYKPAHLEINGNDLKSIGVPQGRDLGRVLSILMLEVLDETLTNDKDILIRRAMDLI